MHDRAGEGYDLRRTARLLARNATGIPAFNLISFVAMYQTVEIHEPMTKKEIG